MINLYIDNEHCSSVGQLKQFFKAVTSYDSPIVMDLLEYGRAGDISDCYVRKENLNLRKL